MKIVRRIRSGKIKEIIREINSVKELEEYITNCEIKIKINDFIRFNERDYPYLENLLLKTEFLSPSELISKQLKKHIFKYRTKNQLNYWVCRGYSENESRQKVCEFQSRLGKSTWVTRRKNPNNKETLNTCIEYWLRKGYSKVDAEQKLKERQNTFTLEKCIKKHGDKLGKEIYKDRQRRWIESLYNGKTDEEIIEFEKSKMMDFCKASKESLKVFLPLIDKLKKNSIITDDNQYYIGYNDKKEYFLYNKENRILFFYDFVIPNMNIIIEFNGRIWHPNGDSWKPLGIVSQTKEQILHKEKLKEETAIIKGFKLLKIWDTELPSVNIEKCFDFIVQSK